ncbi:hypothetical protein PtB15_4B471 [Puccinia triticina]|nr:hypothetical protein PtB15_4B471 [Puccinia triticina]
MAVICPHPTGYLPPPDQFYSLTQLDLFPHLTGSLPSPNRFFVRHPGFFYSPHGFHTPCLNHTETTKPVMVVYLFIRPNTTMHLPASANLDLRFTPLDVSLRAWGTPTLTLDQTSLEILLKPLLARAVSAPPLMITNPFRIHLASQSLRVVIRSSFQTPASHSNYSGHIGPQGHHSQVLFLQSPLERAAPPTQLLQSTPQGSPFKYTFSSPLPGRNPSFQFSAPSVSKPPPKKRAPRRKAPSRPCAKDVVPPEPTPAAPAEINSAETQMRIPLSDAP